MSVVFQLGRELRKRQFQIANQENCRGILTTGRHAPILGTTSWGTADVLAQSKSWIVQ